MKYLLIASLCLSVLAGIAYAQEQPAASKSGTDSAVFMFVPTVAVLPFEARGRDLENDNVGKSVSELVGVALMEGGINTVERAELNKALEELNLSAVGLADSASQVKLGRLIGAKILITGSVFKSGDKNYVVAKIIGTETSLATGTSVNGSAKPADLLPELNKKIIALLEKRGESLLPKEATVASASETLEKVIKGAKRKVYVKVSESINVPMPDPAAQTELEKLLLKLGFEVVPLEQDAEFSITGEAFAENAGTYHKFTSASARVEMKITDVKDKKLLASGAQRERLAGSAYADTAKSAIGQSALRLAQELFPVMK